VNEKQNIKLSEGLSVQTIWQKRQTTGTGLEK